MTKKIFSILLISISLLVLNGCEKDFNSVIDPKINNIQVASVVSYDRVVFNPADPSITFAIKFVSVDGLNGVSFNIFSPSNNLLNEQPVELLDNGDLANNGDSAAGDLTYSNKFLMSSNFASGSYNVEYKITLSDGSKKVIASQHFNYDNGKTNLPPVLSNLIQQDTVRTTIRFTFSVKVNDPDGLQDIKKVYYELFTPNGTKIVNNQGISQFPLFDDGNTASNGDAAAGDGRYTVFLTFPSTVTLGSWKFDFTANDKAGNNSNTISHNVEVK